MRPASRLLLGALSILHASALARPAAAQSAPAAEELPAPPPGFEPADPATPPPTFAPTYPPGPPPQPHGHPPQQHGYPPPMYPQMGRYAPPQPLVMRDEERPRTGLAVGGGVMFGVAYAISAAVAGAGASDRNDRLLPLFIPLAGPFVTLATARVFEGSREDGLAIVGKTFGGIGLILDGLVQVGGVAMLVVGLTTTKTVQVPVVAEAPSLAPDIALGPAGATARWRY